MVLKSTIFWNIMMYSPWKVNRHFEETCCLHFQGRRISRGLFATLVSCSAYSFTHKMDAICSSEIFIDFQRTTRRYISQEIVLFK
jgi:hypothetical protein